jgi:hypothetical protein
VHLVLNFDLRGLVFLKLDVNPCSFKWRYLLWVPDYWFGCIQHLWSNILGWKGYYWYGQFEWIQNKSNGHLYRCLSEGNSLEWTLNGNVLVGFHNIRLKEFDTPSWAWSMHEDRWEMCTKFYVENMNGKDYLLDRDVGGRIIFGLIKETGCECVDWNQVQERIQWWAVVNRVMNFQIRQRWGISWLGYWLLDSQEGLCSIEFVLKEIVSTSKDRKVIWLFHSCLSDGLHIKETVFLSR